MSKFFQIGLGLGLQLISNDKIFIVRERNIITQNSVKDRIRIQLEFTQIVEAVDRAFDSFVPKVGLSQIFESLL